MARNYAALPHEYLEEMDILSDAEFGRLCRALLQYSMDGKEGQLEGAEKVLWKRVKRQEDRFKESYKEQAQSKKNAGKKGAEKRWHGMAGDSTAIAKDGKAITGMAGDSKNAYTKTKTETETNILSSDDEENTRASAPPSGPSSSGSAVSFFLDRVNPTPAAATLELLADYERDLGPEVCIRAMLEALDAGKPDWRYIQGILRNKRRDGIRSLAAWDAHEAKRKKQTSGKEDQNGTDMPPEYHVGDWL